MTLMELASVLPGAEIGPSARGLEVARVTADSRSVRPGDVFVAVRGARYDGLDYAADAVRRGAVAVVADRPAPAPTPVAWIAVGDARKALARMAARLHGDPAEKLVLAGVTGTNGKTSTTTLLEAILARKFGTSGFLGTVGYRTPRRSLEADRTTPDATVVQELLAEMVADGARAAALEVSSHALVLDRVEGCLFDVAVFTNLTRDHLDFHGDMDSYYAAKKLLFDRRKPGAFAVVNADDPYGRRLLAEVAPPAGPRIRLARIEAIAPGLQLADHRSIPPGPAEPTRRASDRFLGPMDVLQRASCWCRAPQSASAVRMGFRVSP